MSTRGRRNGGLRDGAGFRKGRLSLAGIPVLFIGGCMRSGTTLVQRLLCAAPGVNPAIAECHYLTELLAAHKEGEKRFDLFLSDYFASREAFDAFGRGTLRRFLVALSARYPEAKQLVLKNPELAYHFSLAARLLPEARFILVVRDPRDIIASMLRVAERQRAAGLASSLVQAGRDMERLSDLVIGYYADSYSNAPLLQGRLHVVRYESIAQGDPAALQALGRFAGLALDGRPAALAPETWQRQRQDQLANSFWSPGWQEATSKPRIGGYAGQLDPAEIAVIERQCAPFARSFQYW
jgi:sulfotransferase family protein